MQRFPKNGKPQKLSHRTHKQYSQLQKAKQSTALASLFKLKPGMKATKGGSNIVRPLNSFFAFRKYMGPLFKSNTQKDISALLKKLWAEDRSKGKWAILAKAYSIMRQKQDHGAIHLGDFLAKTTSMVGIGDPNAYLHGMGWSLVHGAEGINVQRTHPPAKLETGHRYPVSINDILEHAVTVGLYTGNLSDVMVRNGSSMTVMIERQVPRAVAFNISDFVDYGNNNEQFSPAFLCLPNSDLATAMNEVETNAIGEDDYYRTFIPGYDTQNIMYLDEGDPFDAYDISSYYE